MTISVSGQADYRRSRNAADQGALAFDAKQARDGMKRDARQVAREVQRGT
ncbi:hypothetical protein TMM008_57830 [Pseudomonas sp. 008]|nr:hypothetical protein TMM008_57830 [Pseudomonas sp. 008]